MVAIGKIVSIALATYNGSKYLSEQLESLLTQTRQADEIVICDDCSTDDTRAILEQYANISPVFRVYYNDKNLGFKDNFAKALSLCSGDFIALCDQDDIWDQRHLELLLTNAADNYVICGDSSFIDTVGNSLNLRLSEAKNYSGGSNTRSSCLANFILYYYNPFQGASMLLSRNFLNLALPIPQNVHYHDVWFAIIACLFDKFKYVDTPITLYRMHGVNVSGNHSERHCRFRTFAGHFLKKDNTNNRVEVIYGIYTSKFFAKMPETGKKILSEANVYYNNRNTFVGLLKNFIFEIRNREAIYYGK